MSEQWHRIGSVPRGADCSEVGVLIRGEATGPPAPPPRRPPGRPPGKRTDPAYDQVTAYIRGETHRRVKVALIEAGDRQEFSELVEQLLTGWLGARGT